jgi:hypothetical protein
MGQMLCTPEQELQRVDKAVEAIEELVWNDSTKIDSHAISNILENYRVHEYESLKKIENAFKEKQAEHERRYRFFLDKAIKDINVLGLKNASCNMCRRYSLVLSYLHLHVSLKT